MVGPKVIFENKNYLVVDKPAGLVVMPGAGHEEISNTLAGWVADHVGDELVGVGQQGRWGLVHRLDKDVSGVMAVAKTKKAYESLISQFKQREVEKEYWALVFGALRPSDSGEHLAHDFASAPKGAEASQTQASLRDSGRREGGLHARSFSRVPPAPLRQRFGFGHAERGIERQARALASEIKTPIGRHPKKRLKFRVDPQGKPAVTELRVIREFWVDGGEKRDRGDKFILLGVFPKTGRTHQIRVHLQFIGHPIVGDRLYSGRKRFVWSKETLGLTRPFLHAKRLKFKMVDGAPPKADTVGEFESELPKDLWTVLEKLESGKSQ